MKVYKHMLMTHLKANDYYSEIESCQTVEDVKRILLMIDPVINYFDWDNIDSKTGHPMPIIELDKRITDLDEKITCISKKLDNLCEILERKEKAAINLSRSAK